MSEPIMHGSSDDWNKMNPQFRTRLLNELTRLQAEVERRKNTDPTEQHLWFNYYVRPRLLGYQFPLALMTNPTSRLLRTEREENARLKAEVERLRKAGDDLSASLTIHSNHPNCGARDEWLRAKKGFPSLAEQWEREKNNNDRAAKEGKPSV